ncbi:MAG: FtsW/RodA/SpoVE family cell cycle protein [Clostridia bacterium]|nr:FtsW/RodA/SpoVE family cell cycle protein [Clostridia bacterium]
MSNILSILKKAWRETDNTLLLLCMAASMIGFVLVRSATEYSRADDALMSRDLRAMIIAVVAGLAVALFISFIDYDNIVRLWPIIAGAGIALMLLTLLIGVGPSERSDVRSWIQLPGGFYFQSSELLKIMFIITFGAHLDLVKDHIRELKTVLLLVLHGAIPTLLVVITGDMGSALIFMVIFAVMIFMGGIAPKHIAIAVLAVAAALPFAWRFVLGEIQKERIIALLYPEDYPDIIYQQDLGLTAIGSGGWTGAGLMQGRYTQLGRVPERQNDFIFTVIGEELGFIGCVFTLLILALIIIKIIHTGKNARDNSTTLMCYGLAAMLTSHIVVNVGMCLMLLPVVGITLPFYSAGGSANLCLYVGVGLALSIYRYNREGTAVNFKMAKIRTPFME